MEIKFNGKEYIFGRKPKVPERETSLIYYDNGFNISRLNSTMTKEMTSTRLRNFAKTPVVRRAINITKNTLLNCQWTVEKKNLNDDGDYSNEIDIISRCLNEPNYEDDFRPEDWGVFSAPQNTP